VDHISVGHLREPAAQDDTGPGLYPLQNSRLAFQFAVHGIKRNDRLKGKHPGKNETQECMGYLPFMSGLLL
jgi:hypothetical protein